MRRKLDQCKGCLHTSWRCKQHQSHLHILGSDTWHAARCFILIKCGITAGLSWQYAVCALGDALRPFVIHAFGGVYLDFDVECFKPMDALLHGYDLVLQSAEADGQDVTNAVMASTANQSFWLDVAAMLQQNAHHASSIKDKAHAILSSTGPQLLQQAFYAFVGVNVSPGLKHRTFGDWTVSSLRVHVYAMQEWFVPCVWDDARCHQHITHLAHNEPASLPQLLVGHHHNAATWLKPIKDENRRWTLKLMAVTFGTSGVIGLLVFVQKRHRRANRKAKHISIA